MSTSKKLLRWLGAAPVGIIAAALVMFPVHWLVMINLGGWGMDPIIEIRDPNTLRSIESVLQAAFGPFAFIYGAARTAPNHRMTTAVLLSGIVVIGLPIIAWYWNTQAVSNGNGVLLEHGFTRILANVVGTAVAILLMCSHERRGPSAIYE